MLCNSSSDGYSICRLQLFAITNDTENVLDEVNYWVNGVFGGTVAITGLIMNTLTMIILCSMPEWKHMMNYLLTLLLLINNLFLITQVINILVYNFNVNELMMIIPNIVYPMEKTILTMGVFCTIGLAHQAYLITWDHDQYRNMSSSLESLKKRTLAYAIPIVFISAVINIPRWFSYKLKTNQFNYEKTKTTLKTNFFYIVYYENFVLNILTVCVPITLLVFFNWSVHKLIKEWHQGIESSLSTSQLNVSLGNKESKERKKLAVRSKPQTNILIIIIFLFIACNFPRCILKFSDGFPKNMVIKIMETLGRVLQIAYASATPFIYLTKNTRFRNQLFVLFNKICLCRRVSSYEVEEFANTTTEKSKEKLEKP